MTKILHVSASIRGDDSVSRQISTRIAQTLSDGSDTAIIERDLATNDLPYVDAAIFAANGTPSDDRTPEQGELAAIADTLIDELKSADAIVLGIPMYNFGAPAIVKAWADLVARAGTTFRYTPNGPEGLLTGKKAYIALATGGTAIGSEIDYLSGWLTHFLKFLGVEVAEIIVADGMMSQDGPAKIEAALEKASQITA
ncbi:MAG: NAD(P)H-dependent oxidoreductase [Pseudomonadota bacterium]